MKILYHILHPNVNAAERWIYEAWRDGFAALGHAVSELRAEHDFEDRIREVNPDLFMTDISVLEVGTYADVLENMRTHGIKIAIWVHWPLVSAVGHKAETLIRRNIADLYFGERESDHAAFLRDTGKEYICIPHAASPVHHFPVSLNASCASDILYIGSRLPHKRWMEENVIEYFRRRRGYNVRVFGFGWTSGDAVRRVVRKVARELNLHQLKNFIERDMVKIGVDDERVYYSSAKICLNFHEREADGSQPHYIVNQRTFKIPACGGFQICDEVPAIRKYFNDSEIVMLPLNRKQWIDTIDFYLHNDSAREVIRANGIARAQREHMSVKRCMKLLDLVSLGGQVPCPL